MESSKGIDTDLYSRQIGTFGMEMMGKLVQMKVLISGLRGLGVETAKNLILAGPASVVLHDDAIVEMRDLGSNFYLAEEHVGKKTRAEVCASRLAELNPYVTVSVHTGRLEAETLGGLSLVVLTETTHGELTRINEICRASSPTIGFIAADCFGLVGSVFVDHGDAFVCRDKDGEECKSAMVAAITQETPCVVHTHHEKRHGFQAGDWVTFRELQGMTEMNERAPVQIKDVTSPYSFTIEHDTSSYAPYQREGIVTQVKQPHTIKFSSFQKALIQPKPEGGQELPVPDLAKFGRSEQLHIATQAVRQYREQAGQMPNIRDKAAADQCVELAKAWNAERAKEGASALSVDEVDEAVVRNTAMFSRCSICPLAAFLGGVVAQEIVKFTGKYSPLHQCLYIDMFELLPKEEISDWQALGSRYDDQIAIFGKSFQDRISSLNIFLVGAGALGCEFLKCFAMMGAGCSGGNVTVTDMDRIEVSNLNRQFLFRQKDVGTSKSLAAAEAAKVMNPSLQVKAMEVRVGTDTEDTFDDAFWQSLSFVVNALDNIQARLYVDSRCVWFARPLLESGTLGTKANVQVILPYKTQSYGDSQDPPEESIPLCTLKHFPNAIEHTIEWSRDLFEQLFTEAPRDVNTFLSDTNTYLGKVTHEGTGTSQLAKLNGVRQRLEQQGGNFNVCVEYGILEFQSHFHDSIAQLIHTFPLDHMTSEGNLFWSGPKRAPAPIRFDAQDNLHVDFVVAAANLYAATLGIPQCRDRDTITKIASGISIKEFVPKQVGIKVDDKDTTTKEGCADDDALVQMAIREMAGANTSGIKPLTPADFEKDDDSNFHISFIAACANLRARNYKIQEADWHKVKMIAGKIIPAIATTTAMATGLVSAEMLKLVNHADREVDEFKNAFVNLALPLWLMSEPLPPAKTTSKDHDPIIMGPVKAKPEGFTTWDKVEVKLGDCTLRQFVDYLAGPDVGVEVMIISVGNACLYNAYLPAHKKRLDQRITELWETITKQKISPKKSYLTVEVSASDIDDGIDVQIPTIKLQFR